MTKATRTSQRKTEANRRNASKSTGPRTTQGKSRSRLNALKHGILASQAVIANIEGRAERKMFEATVDGLAQDFQPVGVYEQLLVQEIAACFWRKRRLLMFENRAAFDAIEIPAAATVERGKRQLIPWKEPLYAEGDHLTTAEQIYKHSGLDAVTLPNAADTLRVIRYEAAINRTRERAVASLREMKKARRGMAHPGVRIAPAIDRVAAQRNTAAVQAKLLSPWFSIRVLDQFKEEQLEAIRAEFTARHAAGGENDETNPKNLTPEERDRRIRRAMYEVFGNDQPSEEPTEAPRESEDDPDRPPST